MALTFSQGAAGGALVVVGPGGVDWAKLPVHHRIEGFVYCYLVSKSALVVVGPDGVDAHGEAHGLPGDGVEDHLRQQ